jgi:hypothetical protein
LFLGLDADQDSPREEAKKGFDVRPEDAGLEAMARRCHQAVGIRHNLLAGLLRAATNQSINGSIKNILSLPAPTYFNFSLKDE